MNGEKGLDFLIAAMIISVAVHVGLMFWVRPKVMTHVVRGAAHVSHRGPMRVTEAKERPELVEFDRVEDEAAAKEAPKLDATVTLPTEAASTPTAEPVSKIEPPPIAGLAGMKPEEQLTLKIEMLTQAIEAGPSVPKVKMRFGELGTPSGKLPLAPSIPSAPAVARASAPEFTAPPKMPEAAPEEPVKLAEIKKPKAEKFEPVKEVMPTVDEKIVEKEKSAVRELLVTQNALDITRAVSIEVSQVEAKPDGYAHFKVVISPKPGLPNVSKDVVILLDASGSIGNDRLKSCRSAAKEILRTATNTGDRFNLVAFRDRYTYAFRTWTECNAASFEAGDRWLNSLAAHGRTDVFGTISSVLTLPRDPARPLIALVVTDGDANTGVSDTHEILDRFAKLNDGLISVYMYGVKDRANRQLIDRLTYANRGESFIFGGWRWSAGSELEGFSDRFRDPLLTDLRVIFAADCPAEISPALLKNLYRGNTVEFTGRVPAGVKELKFSLRALAASLAYEGFYRLPLDAVGGRGNR